MSMSNSRKGHQEVVLNAIRFQIVTLVTTVLMMNDGFKMSQSVEWCVKTGIACGMSLDADAYGTMTDAVYLVIDKPRSRRHIKGYQKVVTEMSDNRLKS